MPKASPAAKDNDGEFFGKEGSNKTFPEPQTDAELPGNLGTGKFVEKTPFVR